MVNASAHNKSYQFISIIIPCRNEEMFIKECLESVIENDYPKNLLEILIVDGMSTDATRIIFEELKKKYCFIKLINNPQKTTPKALNIGIREARGEIIMRMDAHTIYPKNYINSCVETLIRYNADNAGGVIETVPREQTAIGMSIAAVLSHPFGVGDSIFRTSAEKIREADTVAFGCYRREVFQKIGFFNERLSRSQDIEFNLRLKRAGGKIILNPNIVSRYFASSAYACFVKRTINDGIWAVYPTKFTKKFLAPRHYVALLFVLYLTISAALSIWFPFFRYLFLTIVISYLFLNAISSAQIAYKKQNPVYLVLVPCIFLTFHICYGIGSCIGLGKIFYESIIKKPQTT